PRPAPPGPQLALAWPPGPCLCPPLRVAGAVSPTVRAAQAGWVGRAAPQRMPSTHPDQAVMGVVAPNLPPHRGAVTADRLSDLGERVPLPEQHFDLGAFL